jgi:hypothetical protein
VAVIVAEPAEAHIDGLFTVTVGFGLIVSVPAPEPVQPPASVIVTL